jgi:hypothetical protein
LTLTAALPECKDILKKQMEDAREEDGSKTYTTQDITDVMKYFASANVTIGYTKVTE